MKHTFPKLNITDARARIQNTNRPVSEYINDTKFYAPAYIISNEALRQTTGLTAHMGRNVLTIAGSGDQAMWYTLAGAQKIDTFDITFNAKAIQDIKTTALQILPHDQYIQLLSDVHNNPHVADAPHMADILQRMPADSAQYVRGMDSVEISARGFGPKSNTEHLPTSDEYAAMRAKITKPFKFIWTDATSLHARLTDEYDVINLSNIFEWNPQITIPTLASLRNHVRPGGYILAHTGWIVKNENIAQFRRAQEIFKKWAKLGMLHTKGENNTVIILQRTR